MRKILTFLFAALMSVGMWAAPIVVERVQIGDLYYNLHNGYKTAEVTSQNSSYPYWSTTITTANIPATVTYYAQEYSVTSIGNNAFYNCSGLTSVTIPNSVTSIGNNAFSSCSGLTSVTIPNSVTSIGDAAFDYCTGLASVTIGNSVTSIGGGAFQYCYDLTSITIPNSVESIGTYAFLGCYGLTSVTIPNSVISIEAAAFGGCIGLTSIVVESGNTKYDSRESCNAIIETSSNTLIAGCKNTIIPNSVTSIGLGGFGYCSSLSSVTIPNSVTSIGDAAFYGCTGLTSVTIPNSVISIGNSAFRSCSNLETVTIPNSVISIGESAFEECEGLTSVTIPCSVTSIGGEAFYDCTNITDVYCYPNAADLTWEEDGCDDFKASMATVCHVFASELTAYQAKFTGVVNVTFVGDLTGSCGGSTPTEIDVEANVDPHNTGVYYSTFYDSSNKYELPSGVEAFVADLSGSDLVLTKIAGAGQVIPADNAVILKANSENITLTQTDDEAVSFTANNDLEGVDDATTLASLSISAEKCYVLSGSDEHGVGFYKISGSSLKAHKAYVIYDGEPSGAPRRIRFVFDQATGVESIQPSAVSSQKMIENGQLVIIRNGVKYNAQGQIVK